MSDDGAEPNPRPAISKRKRPENVSKKDEENARRMANASHQYVEQMAAQFIRRHGDLDPRLYALTLLWGDNGGLRVSLEPKHLPEGVMPRPKEACVCALCPCYHHVLDPNKAKGLCPWCAKGEHAGPHDDRTLRLMTLLARWFEEFQAETLSLADDHPEKAVRVAIMGEARRAMRLPLKPEQGE